MASNRTGSVAQAITPTNRAKDRLRAFCRFSLAVRFQQFDHGLAHGFADVHVGLCIAAVVAAGAAAFGQRVAVNGGDVALELGVLAGFAVDREHGIEDLPSVVGGALLGLAECGADELRVGRIEVLAQLLDEMNKVLSRIGWKVRRYGCPDRPATRRSPRPRIPLHRGNTCRVQPTPSSLWQYRRRTACRRTR